jgi:two-component system, sensor histidine kinase and response regulator
MLNSTLPPTVSSAIAKILVIDDEPNMLELILDLLSSERFTTIGASDGRLGIELAMEEVPDIILCDVVMPAFDGYDILYFLRRQPATNHIPFIFVTAQANQLERARGLRLGANGYITKPFTPEELLVTVHDALA